MNKTIIDKNIVLKNLLSRVNKEKIEYIKKWQSKPKTRLQTRSNRIKDSNIIEYIFLCKRDYIIKKYFTSQEECMNLHMFND